jgi:phosphatidylinositol alpha-1,6-mannosyltransferase
MGGERDTTGATVVVTNDFPPVIGGIEAYAAALSSRLPGEVVVVTRRMAGADAVDSAFPHRVVRLPVSPLLPGPRVARAVTEIARRHRADRAWIASAAPLGLLAPALRRGGVRRVVASTHGHEVWWATVPGASSVLRRIAVEVDVLTFVSSPVRDSLARRLPGDAVSRMEWLPPAVDPDVFTPDAVARGEVRAALGIPHEAPVVLAAARLVRRKGVDVLVRAWPSVRAAVRDAHVVVVGDGPDRRRIARYSRSSGGTGAGIHLVGGQPWPVMPRWYAAADLFALPVRTRLGGLEPEAFGICYVEAASAGLPAVAGRSGGTVEAVVDGVTGLVVDGREVDEVAAAVVRLLTDRETADRLARAGRARVLSGRSWDGSARVLARLLDPGSARG